MIAGQESTTSIELLKQKATNCIGALITGLRCAVSVNYEKDAMSYGDVFAGAYIRDGGPSLAFLSVASEVPWGDGSKQSKPKEKLTDVLGEYITDP